MTDPSKMSQKSIAEELEKIALRIEHTPKIRDARSTDPVRHQVPNETYQALEKRRAALWIEQEKRAHMARKVS
jgi:hypothetical protein